KEYAGGCHCGRFRFTFPHVPFEDGQYGVGDCNCSFCSKQGVLWIYGTIGDLKWAAGSVDELTRYQWHKKLYAHYFCPTCGVDLFEHELANDMVGVNARTLDGLDPVTFKREFLDG
ncbi:hypothetical protein PHLGIDRAFT_43224, partial [Phlebiopsis gigantea 11061_1 CR5-6]